MKILRYLVSTFLIFGFAQVNLSAFVWPGSDDSNWYVSDEYDGIVYAEDGDDIYVQRGTTYLIKYTNGVKVEQNYLNAEDQLEKKWTYYSNGQAEDVTYYYTLDYDGERLIKDKTVHYDQNGVKKWTNYFYSGGSAVMMRYEFDSNGKWVKKIREYYGTGGNYYRRNVWTRDTSGGVISKEKLYRKYTFVTTGEYKGEILKRFSFTNGALSKIERYYPATHTVYKRYEYGSNKVLKKLTTYNTEGVRRTVHTYRNGELYSKAYYYPDGKYYKTRYY